MIKQNRARTVGTMICLILFGIGVGSMLINPILSFGQASTGGAGSQNAVFLPSLNINDAFTFPVVDGSASQFLQTNGSGVVSWATGGGGATTFAALTDTPSSFSTANVIYVTNGTPNAVAESTVVLTESTNTFNITKGTATLDIAAAADLNIDTDLTVNTTAVVLNQSLATTSAVTFDDITISTPVNVYGLDHDSFSGFVANEHADHSSISVSAGDGLTGGGTIAATRTLTMGTPTALTASTTDAVTTSSHSHSISGFVPTDGVTVVTPSSDQSLGAGDSLTVSDGIMRLKSSSGSVTSTADPFIVSPAGDGTCVLLQGVNDTDLLTVEDEADNAGSELELKNNQAFTFGKFDVLEVCYDSGEDKWFEIARSDN